MNVLYGGYMDPETKLYPYTIIDMEQTFTNKDDAFGFIKSKVRGNLIYHKSLYQSDNYYLLDNIPNIWQDITGVKRSAVSIVADNGIHFLLDNSKKTSLPINGNGVFVTNRYTSTAISALPSLYLAMKNDGSDVYTHYTINGYENGVLIENTIYNGVAKGVFWFDEDGIIYFTVDSAEMINIGLFSANSTSFSQIGKLESLKVYAIRSVASYAEGKVTDKTGKPFKNARITALRRHNMMVAGEAISGDDGSYRMNLFALKGSELVMVCLDDDGKSPDFEAQIYDRVVVT